MDGIDIDAYVDRVRLQPLRARGGHEPEALAPAGLRAHPRLRTVEITSNHERIPRANLIVKSALLVPIMVEHRLHEARHTFGAEGAH